jgi:hypothetical protein
VLKWKENTLNGRKRYNLEESIIIEEREVKRRRKMCFQKDVT